MNHSTEYIKAIFKEDIFLSENTPGEDSPKESIEYASKYMALLKNFMDKKNWILKGKRSVLESELCEALGGSMFQKKDGFYQDNWIIRHINGGYGEYLDPR